MRKFFKNFIIISFLFTLFFIITAYSYATNISNSLNKNIFRLHILANSDSKEDQELKLKIRDNIMNYMEEKRNNENTKQSIIELSKNCLSDFKKIAEKTIKENGYSYPVTAEIGNFYFPTKYYGNISLPAGNYDALRIKIGDAKGQNWWCSLFPPLCFINVSSGIINKEGKQYLKENLSEEELAIISNTSSDIEFKFKIIEFFNKKG